MKNINRINTVSAGMKKRTAAKTKSGIFIVVIIIMAMLPLGGNAANGTGSGVKVIPGGMPFGIRMNSEGLVIEDIISFDGENGVCQPTKDSGLQKGDIIIKVSGKKISSADELTSIVEQSGESELILELMRNEKPFAVSLKAEKSIIDGKYKLGIVVGNGTAGIGTLTFIMPDGRHFAGLGHGICDIGGKEPIPLRSGSVYSVIITSVIKGRQGAPGELHGRLSSTVNGKLTGNLRSGVFGCFDKPVSAADNEMIEIAENDEILQGDAYILTTLNSNKREKYSVKLISLDFDNESGKNFAIEITDKALIELSGGIIQGMSGSPIIQNGKLIGALTHVLVDNPKCGYGISAQNMLKTMPNE